MLAVASLVASIVISAPWANGGTIPKRYTCDGGNQMPAVGFTSYVPGRQGKAPRDFSTAWELVDVDAPGGHFVHWLEAGMSFGRNSFGKIGWSGPCPPHGDPPHRYVLRAWQLRRTLPLKEGFTEAQFRRELRGDVLATGSIVGRYARR